MSCPPLSVWRIKQVDALRVLFRYAAGMHSVRTTIPGYAIFCQQLEAGRGRKAVAAHARNQTRHTNQLNHFKEGRNNLGFVDHGENPKLEYVRQKLWEFYEERHEARADMFDYHKDVYSDEPLSLLDIKFWLTKIYQGPPGPRALGRLCGTYHIYRYGVRHDGAPSIVRSAMIIRRVVIGKDEYLTFDISYPNTSERGTDEIEHISGIILSTLGHYYFIGADKGAASSPYQMIAKHHSQERSPSELSCLLMRHSLRNEVIAARALIVRVSGDLHGEAPHGVYEEDYRLAVDASRVLMPGEIGKDKELDKRRLAKFANTIDPRRAPVLWLLADDTGLPPPPEGQRSDRSRSRRRGSQ